MKKNTDISERINQLLDFLSISKNEFAKKLGYNRSQTVYDIVNGKAKPSFDFFNKLFNSEYSDIVSPEWLLTGKGEMLKGKEMIPAGDVIEKDGISPIPLVEQSVVAGFGSSDFAITDRDVKEYYVVPKFRYHKVDFMIEVYGNSMYPKYNSGDIVACTIINDSQFIQWNKPHVVGTKYQGILVKRILPGKDDNSVILKSDNKDYPPFEVPKSEITGMALVVGVIRSE